jgi:hypothetical protein
VTNWVKFETPAYVKKLRGTSILQELTKFQKIMLILTDAPNIKKYLKFSATNLPLNFQFHLIL